ncbi:MAG: chorismate mutase [Candidatus Pacebacteria bacterium]|nr:chorismate mutase [Candidatus Paceibacterota bacterium]
MLNSLRLEIDEIDEKLICLLAKRLQIAQSIGEHKKEKGLDPLDEVRWQKVINSRIKIGKRHKLSKQFISRVWEEIHFGSLEVQK